MSAPVKRKHFDEMPENPQIRRNKMGVQEVTSQNVGAYVQEMGQKDHLRSITKEAFDNFAPKLSQQLVFISGPGSKANAADVAVMNRAKERVVEVVKEKEAKYGEGNVVTVYGGDGFIENCIGDLANHVAKAGLPLLACRFDDTPDGYVPDFATATLVYGPQEYKQVDDPKNPGQKKNATIWGGVNEEGPQTISKLCAHAGTGIFVGNTEIATQEREYFQNHGKAVIHFA